MSKLTVLGSASVHTKGTPFGVPYDGGYVIVSNKCYQGLTFTDTSADRSVNAGDEVDFIPFCQPE